MNDYKFMYLCGTMPSSLCRALGAVCVLCVAHFGANFCKLHYDIKHY